MPGGRDLSSPDTTDKKSLYVLAPDVRIHALNQEAVVFNPFSWETHLLNPAAALVLNTAAERPCTEAEVEDLLAEVLHEGERSRAPEHARQLLKDLVSLRLLVVRVPDSDAR